MNRLLLIMLCFGVYGGTRADDVSFEKHIAPLLTRRCLGCHTGSDAESGLDLSLHAAALDGGESGPGWVPGDAANSLVWRRVAADEMPEDKPLSDGEKSILKTWIETGAKWEGGPLNRLNTSTDSRAGYDWWSLQPLADSPLPNVEDRSWPRNAIDHFVLARLEEAGLEPSHEAAPEQLWRRLNYNVIGLPPKPAQVRKTLDGYSDRVQELLSSVEYGQHWARHWLDIVRFGESHGFEYNQPRNNAWAFRNWVIDAFNQGMPYDEFVRLQVAGDVLHPKKAEIWAATGFLVAGPHNTTKPSSDNMRKTMRHDELEDIVGAIGQTFLGLTVNCARCHDHKFDPITQKEYYQFVAAVVGIDHGERDLPDAQAGAAKEKQKAIQAKLQPLRDKHKQLKECSDEGAAEIAQLASLEQNIKQLEAEAKRLGAIRAPRLYMAVSRKPPKVEQLKRGDVTLPGEVVVPAGLQAINSDKADFQLDTESSDSKRRGRLATWLTAEDNPLLARVIVNRLWHYHFGQGLVRTPSDFGFNGDRPSHPKLLDFLANQLIHHRWQLKPIHQLILNSATYRQASRLRADAHSIDADNRLLWRMNPQRLTAEQLRDSMLSIAGTLNTAHGGAGYRDMREYKYRGSHYYDPIPPTGANATRRTIYRFSPRGAKRTILDTFDCPDPSAKAPKRQVTTTPLQALSLMNNRFVLEVAEMITERLDEQTQNDTERAALLYRLAYCREATSEELAMTVEFASEQGWAALARVVLNTNEFLYVR